MQCPIIGCRSWTKRTILYSKSDPSSRLSTITISSKLPKSISGSSRGRRGCSFGMYCIWLSSSSLQLDSERIRHTRRYVLLNSNKRLLRLSHKIIQSNAKFLFFCCFYIRCHHNKSPTSVDLKESTS